MTDDGNIPEHILNGLRTYVDLWESHHDLDGQDVALALELLASEREVEAARDDSASEPIADGSGVEVTPDQAWAHFKRTGAILPGHQDTIAHYRAEQVRRGEDVTRVGGDE